MSLPMEFGLLPLASEIIFTAAAVIFCFAIYFKTKEIDELAKYSGIRYFREAFLCFGISYMLRFIFEIALVYTRTSRVMPPGEFFFPASALILGYLSTVAIFYLAISSLWKGKDNKKILIIGHITAVILSVLSFLTHSREVMLYIQSLLFAIAVCTVVFSQKQERKISKAKMLYFLVFALWLINLFTIEPLHFVPLFVKVLFQAASIAVFMAIYNKISRIIPK